MRAGGGMKVVENFEVPKKIIEALKKREHYSGQYSVTKLICCPRKTFYEMTGVKEFVTEEAELIFARGRAHHGVLEVYKLKEISRKRESEVLDKNGKPIPIYGVIDMIGENITEIYTTTISAKKIGVPGDAAKVFPMKLKQLQAYCYFENELKGDLLVFFLFGDYTRFTDIFGKKVYTGMKPQLRAFTFEFTEAELRQVWESINQNLAEIEYAKNNGIPPLSVGEEWECENCAYSYVCLEEPVGKTEDILR
jgi:hypothetical protein